MSHLSRSLPDQFPLTYYLQYTRKDIMDTLTKAQEKLCDTVYQEYDNILRDLAPPNKTTIRRWLKVPYSFYDKTCPKRIEIAASPEAALALATELTGTKQTSLDWCGISDAGWVSFYDYFHRVKVLSTTPKLRGLTKEEKETEIQVATATKELLLLREFMKCAWDTILLDECAIVVRMPTLLSRDHDGNLHSATGPCIEWADGKKDFAWRGVWVPERLILSPRSYTRAEFLGITDTEQRRALGEHAGWDFIVTLLGALCVNVWTDPATRLTYELWKDEQNTYIRKQSPVLQNDSQPFYFERVHEGLTTAQAARKWQACPALTPEQCEKDPVLVYGTET